MASELQRISCVLITEISLQSKVPPSETVAELSSILNPLPYDSGTDGF